MRRLAPRALLALSVVATVLTVAWRLSESWLQAALMWMVVGLLTLTLIRKGPE
jgi:hypothetical protein